MSMLKDHTRPAAKSKAVPVVKLKPAAAPVVVAGVKLTSPRARLERARTRLDIAEGAVARLPAGPDKARLKADLRRASERISAYQSGLK